MVELVRYLALPLALGALIEMLLLRMLMRTGPFLPRAEQLIDLYRGMLLIGTAAANLASLLAMVTILLLAADALQRHRRIDWLAGVLAGASAIVQAWLALAPTSSPYAAVTAITLTALALALAFAASPLGGLHRLGAATILATHLASSYFAVAQPARSVGLHLPGALGAFFAAEALAVTAGVGVLLIAHPGFRRGPAVTAIFVGALLLVGQMLQPSAFALAAMWNFSFSLFLPNAVYGIGAGLYSYALWSLWRERGDYRVMACGLLLVALGGLKLDYGYYSLLALAGYLLVMKGTPVPKPDVVHLRSWSRCSPMPGAQ